MITIKPINISFIQQLHIFQFFSQLLQYKVNKKLYHLFKIRYWVDKIIIILIKLIIKVIDVFCYNIHYSLTINSQIDKIIFIGVIIYLNIYI